MSITPTLNGQIIGQTEKATRAVLDRLLDRTGTTFHQWVVINLVGGEPMTAEADIVARLVQGLEIDEAAAHRAVGDARSLGLVTVEVGTVGLTTPGWHGSRQFVRRSTASPVGSMATCRRTICTRPRRVLTVITARANAELAG